MVIASFQAAAIASQKNVTRQSYFRLSSVFFTTLLRSRSASINTDVGCLTTCVSTSDR
ncbi:MAG: hypothetical protein RMZ41_020390 [Nostoc sp. DedVER02]|uniref:hypothetical protein n=1 Tax=unclassified Nostoc TaxID=2593658 RepID=UPI002AD4E830|nr:MULTISPECIES: hypothetical protein [unclassified Nostoc]MDZ7984866.1 hypothetical protein [Nostoc sp. DedVER02]MDZ8111054.1 hypothetical protein [Nostoc sp. DedVER01b]